MTVFASIFIYLSIAEMASMWVSRCAAPPIADEPLRSPTAGGQYHWVSEFAPPYCQKYLSYISGMIPREAYLPTL